MHIAAHLAILVGYLIACAFVPRVLRSLIHIRLRTSVAGSGFFLFCGLTHLGNALGQQTALWVSVTDHLQAAAILTFIPWLLGDLKAALGRFNQVVGEVEVPTMGRRIAAALQNRPGWDDPGYARRDAPRPDVWTR